MPISSARTLSTVIVETREETWLAHGLDQFNTEQSIAFCERLFGRYLGGHALQSNADHLRGSAWLNFHRVVCKHWHHGHTVLIGDAAHTAHFSIGSGTKLAMEDAISLSRHVTATADRDAALGAYHEERHLEVLKLQSAARNRMEWFENVARYVHLPPEQFAYSLLTGSQRIGHENLKLRDPGFVAVLRALARGAQMARAISGRPCFCRSSCATWSWPTASWYRRWRSTAPWTACPMTGTSSTTATARWAAPAWCTPK